MSDQRVRYLARGNGTISYYRAGVFPLTTFAWCRCCSLGAPDFPEQPAMGLCDGCWDRCLLTEVCAWRGFQLKKGSPEGSVQTASGDESNEK